MTFDVLFQIAEELDPAALHPLSSLSIISSQRLQRRPPLLCDKCVLVPDTALRWKLSLPSEDSSANFYFVLNWNRPYFIHKIFYWTRALQKGRHSPKKNLFWWFHK